jgi:site-specific DNA recombinase
LIFARVSSPDQRDTKTIESQLRELPEYAARMGWIVVGIEKEDGVSAVYLTLAEREIFKAVLQRGEKHDYDVLLVIDLDRLTRADDRVERAIVYERLRRAGILLATPAGGVVDLDNPENAMLVGLVSEFNAYEAKKIKSRTQRGKRQAKEEGRRPPSKNPYGLRWVTPSDAARKSIGQFVEVSDEAEIIRRIYVQAIEDGIGQIVDDLDLEAVRTRAGSRFAASTITKLLRSPLYKGVFPNHPKVKIPAIVDAETWEAAQRAITSRRSERVWQGQANYLLANILKCGVCGRAMWTCNPRSTGHHKYAYYRCSTTNQYRKMGLDGPCGQRHHRVDPLDAAVWSRLADVLSDPVLLREACEAVREEGDPGIDWEKRVADCDRRLDQLTKSVATVQRRERAGMITEEEAETTLDEIAKERKATENNRRIATSNLADMQVTRRARRTIEQQASRLAERLRDATFADRRQILRLVVDPSAGGRLIVRADGSVEMYGAIPLSTDEAAAAFAPLELHFGT